VSAGVEPMKGKLVRIFLAGAFCLCAPITKLIGEQISVHMPITISGEMRLFRSEEESDRLPDQEAKFTVHLFTNGWRYVVDSFTYRMGAGGKAFEAACDGNNIYEVITFDPIVHQKYLEAHPAAGTSGQTARVYNGVIPRTTTPIEIFPFIAFCSQDYLEASKGQNLITNIFNQSVWPTNRVRYKASFGAATDSFPSLVEVYKPGFFDSSGGANWSRNNPLRSYPPPYEAGFLGLEYRVNVWTNLSTLKYPVKSTINYRDLKQYGKQWELQSSVSIIGLVKMVHFGGDVSLTPFVKADTQVADSRFPTKGPSHYFTTTNGFK
jgi:hypothetical protein